MTSLLPSCDIVRHHLAVMGWPAAAAVSIFESRATSSERDVRKALAQGRCAVVLRPSVDLCAAFGVQARESHAKVPAILTSDGGASRARRLRTLHGMTAFAGDGGVGLLKNSAGESVWYWLSQGTGGLLLVGTALAEDLVHYRQGDPASVATDADKNRWGYAGERPNYLFESQRAGEAKHVRHADEWAWHLSTTLSEKTGTLLEPVLPGGAPGAIVITGDDDQAALECYREQIGLLGDTPTTYFLHPRTKHTKDTLKSMLGRPGIELGIHPDALENPDQYGPLFREQARWFRALTGYGPQCVRNHGYLNDGYWGHLKDWLAEGVTVSSNLPGLDGTAINGSMLPARVVLDGCLTSHWSILTAIGDGILSIAGMNSEQAASCVADSVRKIRESAIPGVIVLNLHPENARAARSMHVAALEAIRGGFVSWTISQCVDWFKARDVHLRDM